MQRGRFVPTRPLYSQTQQPQCDATHLPKSREVRACLQSSANKQFAQPLMRFFTLPEALALVPSSIHVVTEPSICPTIYALIAWFHVHTIHHCYVNRFRLLQPYFGHLTCFPFVCVTRKVQGILPVSIRV